MSIWENKKTLEVRQLYYLVMFQYVKELFLTIYVSQND